MRYSLVLLLALVQTALSAPLGTGFRSEAICNNIKKFGNDYDNTYVVPVQRLDSHYKAAAFRPIMNVPMPLSKAEAHFRMADNGNNGKNILDEQGKMMAMDMSSGAAHSVSSAAAPTASSASFAVAVEQSFIGMEDTGDMKMMARPVTAAPKATPTPRLQYLKYNAGC